MTYKIAVYPDYFRHKNGEEQSFSSRWTELAKRAGMLVKTVDVFAEDIVDQLADCDGVLWRPFPAGATRECSRHLLPAIEVGLRIPIFPNWRTHWHSESKIAQKYMLEAAGLPSPRTWVFWRLEDALAYCRSASYPLVMKLSSGYQSNGVQLLHGADEAIYWVQRMFSTGATSFGKSSKLKLALASRIQGLKLLAGRSLPWSLERRYFYVQEFLPNNTFDTRITVIGNRAFAFRRFNRPDDFRASGSGLINWEPDEIDTRAVRLALLAAQRLGTQSLGVDILYRDSEPVIGETTYTYASWAVRNCPGHWELDGDPLTGKLKWCDGQVRPEDAIFEDFLAELRRVRPSA